MRLTLKASERRDPHSAAQLSMTQCLIAVANGQAQEGNINNLFPIRGQFYPSLVISGLCREMEFPYGSGVVQSEEFCNHFPHATCASRRDLYELLC